MGEEMKPALFASRVLIAVALFVWPFDISATAQTTTPRTSDGLTRVSCGSGSCFYLNGYFWNLLGKDGQAAFISGYQQAAELIVRTLSAKAQDLGNSEELLLRFVVVGVGIQESLNGVNGFYATPDNLAIPICRALQVVSAQKAGLDEAAIRKQTEEFRREAGTYK
jgi:hypothetical protein